jgi:hypothetical protein
MPTPVELREQSRRYRQAACAEPELHLKRSLANHAFALAQLAERLERDTAARFEQHKRGFY